jgi:hypothetical protein
MIQKYFQGITNTASLDVLAGTCGSNINTCSAPDTPAITKAVAVIQGPCTVLFQAEAKDSKQEAMTVFN